MGNKNWKSEYPDDQRPWDPDSYETGSTRPPKSHRGILALLLILVIFLCGAASAMGLLNIRLFSQPEAVEEPQANVSFFTEDEKLPMYTIDPEITEPALETVPKVTSSVELLPPVQSQENITQSGGLSLQKIYEKVIDSVVSITCARPGGQSTGTGVILSADGYIVTNAHVVEGAVAIQVTLTDGRELPATLVGSDAVSDLAVLYIVADNLVSAEFGDSGALRVGDAVAAIGDPLGVALRGTMTNGIVSAINRDITTGGRTMTLIQTNAALNSGNSGGPLINCYGQVIGINTMKIGDYMNAAGVEGLGFAIPSTTVKQIVDQLITQGYVSGRPDIGITGENVSLFHQRYYGLPAGLYITEVTPGSDAEEKGIQAGDVLVMVGDTYIMDLDTLNSLLYGMEPGDTVQVTIFRGRRQYTVELTLAEAKGQ